jgi:hypothetical protein
VERKNPHRPPNKGAGSLPASPFPPAPTTLAPLQQSHRSVTLFAAALSPLACLPKKPLVFIAKQSDRTFFFSNLILTIDKNKMRFFTTAVVAVSAFASTVYGLAAPVPATTTTVPPAVPTTSGDPLSGGANPIRAPLGDVALVAGEPFEIKWCVFPFSRFPLVDDAVAAVRSDVFVFVFVLFCRPCRNFSENRKKCVSSYRITSCRHHPSSDLGLISCDTYRTPNYGDQVTLVLRKGEDSNNLASIADIASELFPFVLNARALLICFQPTSPTPVRSPGLPRRT